MAVRGGERARFLLLLLLLSWSGEARGQEEVVQTFQVVEGAEPGTRVGTIGAEDDGTGKETVLNTQLG